jgi:hypothetical protein
VSRWLAGVVGLGAAVHQRPRPHAARGRFFNPSALGKRAAPRPSGPGPNGLAGMAKLAPLFPGGPGGGKLLFTTHRPYQMYKKKTLVVHVTRW